MLLSKLLVLALPATSAAFQSVLVQRRHLTARHASHHDEFDYLLRETATPAQSSYNNRRQMGISLGDSDKTLLVSSVAAPATSTFDEDMQYLEDDQALDGSPQEGEEVFSGSTKVMQYQEQRAFSRIDNKLKSMDFQDIVITLIVPSILLFAGGRWTYNRVSARIQSKIETTLDSFAEEMIYHDGDFEEMRMCVSDYNKKLVYLGPLKRDKMVKRYLQAYAKRKIISPQAISSLSYAFSVFNLDEETAANLMVSLCREMGTSKIASAGKLLFLGSRILKSAQGKKALLPIRDLVKSTYRESAAADTLMDISQQAMAEAAYKTTVLTAGKTQSKLTPGWEVLGLQKDVAQRIWDEAAEEGFITDREVLYKGQLRKYDKNGNIINEEGELVDPENAIKKDDDSADKPVSGVFECGQCGFTLFVATGRESKFYGSSFKCPECGAPKSDFTARDDFGEDGN